MYQFAQYCKQSSRKAYRASKPFFQQHTRNQNQSRTSKYINWIHASLSRSSEFFSFRILDTIDENTRFRLRLFLEKMMARLRDERDTIHPKPESDLTSAVVVAATATATAASASSLSIGTSRRWSGFKNPRIVRVSRTFGGKDRHSKVCTIRGLRDRRIRLSVPTAIQLYDLQERLGLNQPSKVIDWLLDATKLDIDELPPLHFPQFHDQQSLIAQSSNNYTPQHFTPYLDANLTLMNNQSSSLMLSRKEGININDNLDDEEQDGDDEDKWSNYNKASNVDQDDQVSSQSFIPSLMNSNTMMPNYGNLYNWEPSSLSLSQFGNHGFLATSEDSNHQLGSSSTQQLFFCLPSMPTTTASLFPHNDTSAAMSSAFYPSGSGNEGENATQL